MLASGKARIPDTSARRGSTYLLKSTPKSLSRLKTRFKPTKHQEVSGTFNMNGDFVQSWAHLGHNMIFSTWR